MGGKLDTAVALHVHINKLISMLKINWVYTVDNFWGGVNCPPAQPLPWLTLCWHNNASPLYYAYYYYAGIFDAGLSTSVVLNNKCSNRIYFKFLKYIWRVQFLTVSIKECKLFINHSSLRACESLLSVNNEKDNVST